MRQQEGGEEKRDQSRGRFAMLFRQFSLPIFVICGWRDRLGLCALRLADSAISRQSVAQTGTRIQTPPSCGLTLQG